MNFYQIETFMKKKILVSKDVLLHFYIATKSEKQSIKFA